MNPDDTIVAVASAPGPGRRAIVRVSGPDTRKTLSTVFDRSPQPGSFVPGSLRLSGVHSPLPAEVYFWPGPRSYTGQDLAEIHTVSSPPLVEGTYKVELRLDVGMPALLVGETTLRRER